MNAAVMFLRRPDPAAHGPLTEDAERLTHGYGAKVKGRRFTSFSSKKVTIKMKLWDGNLYASE